MGTENEAAEQTLAKFLEFLRLFQPEWDRLQARLAYIEQRAAAGEELPEELAQVSSDLDDLKERLDRLEAVVHE